MGDFSFEMKKNGMAWTEGKRKCEPQTNAHLIKIYSIFLKNRGK